MVQRGAETQRTKDRRKATAQTTAPESGTETTAEVLYCQMFSFGIPKECEKWHLNRLLTLIRVCQESQAPAKKMSKGDRMAQQRMLNEQRKARLKTRG